MNQSRPPEGAQAALRALRLLKLFSVERPDLSLAEISKASGLNKTTTHRLLRALQSEGFIEKNPTGGIYRLGAGLMALGVQALASNDMRRRIRPLLKALARETGETATLEVPVEDSMLILDEITGSHVVAATGNIGTRWPLHATSTGKAWIAFEDGGMDRLGQQLSTITASTLTRREAFQEQVEGIRKRGYAVSIDELEEGFTGIATVIRGALGDVQGALSVCGPTQRLSVAKRAKIGVSLRRAAARISPVF